MAEWVILESPASMLMLVAALFFNLFDRRYGCTKGVFTLLSAVLCLAACGVLCLDGAGLRELAAILTVFLLLNIGERV